MGLFAILSPTENPKLEASIKEKFPDNYKITSTQWVVSSKGTAQQIADKVGISEGDVGNGVVLSFNNYWGRADAGLWEWMKDKIEASGNG